MPVLSKNPRDIHDACKEAVVDSLLNNLSARLAGREEFCRVILAMQPHKALTSEFLLPKPAAERDGDEEASPIEISAHGLDFQVSTQALNAPMRIQITGAVYVRVLPTADEIALGGPLEPSFPLDKDVQRQLTKDIAKRLADLRKELGLTRWSKNHPDWAARSEAARRGAYQELGLPFELAIDNVRAAPDEEEAYEKAQATPQGGTVAMPADQPGAADGSSDNEARYDDGEDDQGGSAPAGASMRATAGLPDSLAKAIAPPAKWVRLDLQLPEFEFTPDTAVAAAKQAETTLNAAVAEQLTKWAESDVEPYGGKLWGYRHGARMRPSDLKNWQGFLERMRTSSMKVVVPKLTLRWDVHVTDDPLHADRKSLHVALENWSDKPSKSYVKEMEAGFFGVSLALSLPAAAHRALTLDRVKPSYRYNAYLSYPALGFNGAVTASSDDEQLTLATTWAPRYVLPRIVPRDHGVVRNITALAQPDGLVGLDPLLASYEAWLAETAKRPVDRGLSGPNAAEQNLMEQTRLQSDLQEWRSELEAVRAGIEILKFSREHWSGPGPQADERGVPFEAWIAMNTAMARVAQRKGYDEWRLFQLAFILANIPAFATRIPKLKQFYTPEVARNGNAVTLLYFATGGGKSEAFLGLLVFVLFLDRLRGKHRGVSAMMRYPLRLLTLQQARRTFSVMAEAEKVRHARKHPGEPFSLGFWVGKANTPNWHADEGYNEVPSVVRKPPCEEARLEQDSPTYRSYKERWLKLGSCPFCNGKGSLGLRRADTSEGGNALGTYCTALKADCSWNARFDTPTPLPFWVVDEDIYDLAPSVLLGTVDKLAALGQSQGTIRKFFGLFGFAPLIATQTGRLSIPGKAAEWEGEPGATTRPLYPSFAGGEKRFFDPFPTLLIQDEAHLLDESLGTFAGLFESALEAAFDELTPLLGDQVICEPDSRTRRKLKVIAASATVTEPARQMKNLYQRQGTVQFPYPGPDLYESFYAQPMAPDNTAHDVERVTVAPENVELRSHWARVYGAVLTNGHKHTVAMASVLGHFHLLITSLYERLRSGEATRQESARGELLRWVSKGRLAAQHLRELEEASAEELLTLVDLHRIALTYVTNKKGGDQVIDTEQTQFEKLHLANGIIGQRLTSELISGAVSAADIQDIVRRAEDRVKENEPFPELNETLRSIIATSAISHGVDVEEFNSMFFAGIPSDIAEYIQASSRVGRTHVGFSLLVPIPQRYRDRFVLEVHDIFHRFLERMIMPAAVDRWAEKALVRVMPSFFQEYVCGVNAIRQVCEEPDDKKRHVRSYFWAEEVAHHVGPAANIQQVERFMEHALGLTAETSLQGAEHYRQLLKRELKLYREDLENSANVKNTSLGDFFERRDKSLRPMISLRDVDLPGTLCESYLDADNNRVPKGVTARVMRFIRRGPGGDLDG